MLKTDVALCSRYRTSKSHCQKCVDFCPIPGAIQLTEAGVRITDECVQCGVCYSACPNGAIFSHETDNKKLKDLLTHTLSESPGIPIKVQCGQAEGGADITVPCLSCLTESFFLESFRQGASRIELLQPSCKECPWQKSAGRLEALLPLVEHLLEFVRIDRSRILQSSVPFRASGREEEAPEAMNRRDFLSLLKKRTTEGILSTLPNIGEPKKTPREIFSKKVRQRQVNEKRRDLLAILKDFTDGDTKKITCEIFAEIEIGTECFGCNVCETLCPVGAIERDSEKEHFSLNFHPELCTNCQVCVVACMPGAIRTKEFELSHLKSPQKIKLIEVTTRVCSICQVEFIATDEETDICRLCQAVRKRQQAVIRKMRVRER